MLLIDVNITDCRKQYSMYFYTILDIIKRDLKGATLHVREMLQRSSGDVEFRAISDF